MVAAAVAKKAPKPTTDNAMLYLVGGVVALWLLKNAALSIYKPIAKVAKQAVYVGDELTGGIQGDPTTATYWTEVDWPFVDVNTPLVNLKEPDESWMDYVTTVDLPHVPAYNIRDVPGDIKGLFGRVF